MGRTRLGGDFRVFGEIPKPANPSPNFGEIYCRDLLGITTLFFLDSAGTETDLLVGGGGGGITSINADATAAQTLTEQASKILIADDLSGDHAFTIGTDIVDITKANAFGDFNQTFKDNRLLINNPADTFAYTFVAAAIGGARNLNLPLVTADDTIAVLNLAQAFQNKSIDADLNTITNIESADLKATAGILTTQLADSANFVLSNQANSYTAGVRQDFLGLLAGTAGLNVGGIAGNPTTQVNGDIWLNTSTNQVFARINGVDVDLGAGAGGGENNTISSQGGGTFLLTAAVPKSGVDLRVISVSNGDGMNASLATDVLTLAVASTVVQTDQANIYGDFAQTFKDNRIVIESPNGLTPTTIANLQQTVARTLSIPILTANRNFVVTGEASQIALGTEVTGASTDLSDSANLARNTDNLGFFAATTSLQLAGIISDESGSGLLVFNDTPIILTPTIADLTNMTHDHSNAAGGGNLTNAALTSGVFAAIIGLGVQSQDLDMGNNDVNLGTGEILVTSGAVGDILKHEATGFVRFVRGGALQVLKVNAGGTDLEYGLISDANIAATAEINVTKLLDGTSGQFIRTDAAGTGVEWTDDIFTINFIIDGGGSAITTGIKGQVVVDFDCEVIEWAIIGLPAGAIVVDVSKSTFAGFPTTVSIAGTELPTITATNDTGEDRVLTWTAIVAGDILEFEVDSVTTIERVTIALKARKTG